MKLKIIFTAMLTIFLTTSVFAGSEDWKGSYTIELPNGNTTTIIHTPTFVQFTFIRAGTCINLAKGSSMNGLVIQQDLKLCVSLNVEEFTDEAEKLGIILEKNIILGPTYIN